MLGAILLGAKKERCQYSAHHYVILSCDRGLNMLLGQFSMVMTSAARQMAAQSCRVRVLQEHTMASVASHDHCLICRRQSGK